MVDAHNSATRSKNMPAVKSKDTKPEITIRKNLFSKGFRYRLHDKKLPGSPDLVLKKFNTCIFINGCFWHMLQCDMFVFPKSNINFWKKKLESNRKRDNSNLKKLLEIGWRVIIVWECSLRGKNKLPLEEVIARITNTLINNPSKISVVSII